MKIDGKRVILEGKDANRLYNKGFGKFKGKKLHLSLIEACYLIEKNKLKHDLKEFIEYAIKKEKNFEISYLVYRDLRERGYILAIDNAFYLYERGARPPSPPSYLVIPVSEREIFSISKLIGLLEKNAMKIMIGVVDEEGDITYYISKFFEMRGKFKEAKFNGFAYLLKDRCIVWDEELMEKLKENFIGRDFKRFILLSLMEAAYIMERGARIIKDGKEIGKEDFMKYAKKIQPDIKERLLVYEDMKRMGLLPKTGFKFGSHFRVYEISPDESHAPYLVHVVKPSYKAAWAEISRAIRLAHSVKKEMVFAVVSNDIKYIRLKRITP